MISGRNGIGLANNRRFGPADYIKVTVFGFALAALWNGLHRIILPLRLQDFVAETEKNTYLSYLLVAGLVLAMLVQPIAGEISDHSRFRRGRRRPFVLIGVIGAMLFLPGIGLAGSYAAIFATYCLLQVSSNIAQGPYQGFIPDLVPPENRGLASGVKSLLEILGGIALVRLVAMFMDHYSSGEGDYWLWLSVGTLAAVLLGTAVATLVLVKEKPWAGTAHLSFPSALYRSFQIDFRVDRDFVWFLASRLLIFMAFAILQKFALYFIQDVIGIANPAAAASELLIAIGIGMLIIVYPAGQLSDRIGRKPLVMASGLLGALATGLLFFNHSYQGLILSGALLGLANGAFMSTNWALAVDLAAKGEEARYLGLTNIATAGGSALALLIIGPAIDFFNARSSNLGYSVMLGACFVCFISGSLLLLRIRGRRQAQLT